LNKEFPFISVDSIFALNEAGFLIPVNSWTRVFVTAVQKVDGIKKVDLASSLLQGHTTLALMASFVSLRLWQKPPEVEMALFVLKNGASTK